MATHISQREARRLRARVAELEIAEAMRRTAWCNDWPGGVHIGSVACTNEHHVPMAVHTARRLCHAVVVTVDGQTLHLYALPLAGACPT